MRLSFLIVLSLASCARAVPPPTEPTKPSRSETTHEAGYVNGDGIWRPCDPIDDQERAHANDPAWHDGCRKSERMGNVSAGFSEGPEWDDQPVARDSDLFTLPDEGERLDPERK